MGLVRGTEDRLQIHLHESTGWNLEQEHDPKQNSLVSIIVFIFQSLVFLYNPTDMNLWTSSCTVTHLTYSTFWFQRDLLLRLHPASGPNSQTVWRWQILCWHEAEVGSRWVQGHYKLLVSVKHRMTFLFLQETFCLLFKTFPAHFRMEPSRLLNSGSFSTPTLRIRGRSSSRGRRKTGRTSEIDCPTEFLLLLWVHLCLINQTRFSNVDQNSWTEWRTMSFENGGRRFITCGRISAERLTWPRS